MVDLSGAKLLSMSSSLLTKEGESVCIVRQRHRSSYLVYKLERIEEYSFQFYGVRHRFKIGLNKDLPFSEQPYGLLGSFVDLSGRAISVRVGKERKPVIYHPGKRIITLDNPIYSFIGEFNKRELNRFLEGYSREKRDIAYASISTYAFAVGDFGDDLYLKTLFFMTGGYGILAEISAVAGRGIEDCCSPEFYYKAYKVKLETNPLRLFQEKDVAPGANLVERGVSSNPGVIKPVSVRSSEDPEGLDILLNELFITFRPAPFNLTT